MGGKSGTTTSSVQIPPEVLARYNSVNAQAQNVAATPFQQYSTNPNAFVAPVNQQQYAGIGGINQAANMAQPSIAYAQQGYTPEGFQKGVQGYMNPYLQNAVGATAAQLQNVNQQQQQQLAGNAISSGAFGGDRAGIAQGNLMNQQNLAFGQTIGNMENQGYQQAAQNYMGGLGQIGNLGLQGQQAALQGAQAQLGAGTLEQQTQQAGQTALYNQFQQQQAYPFQVAQFLAGIAEGTGALSGSTSTTTSPTSFFSDRRLKEDIKQVGKAHNGLPIYTFKYKGDPNEHTHVGFMADEVEKIHPEAVGMSHGFKTVDYKRAAKYSGGVVAEGGAVMPQHMGQGFADGGMTVAEALNNMNSMQANMPVSGGGVNNGVAASAAALNPAPVVPAAALEAPKNYFLNSPDLANSQAGAGKVASSSTWGPHGDYVGGHGGSGRNGSIPAGGLVTDANGTPIGGGWSGGGFSSGYGPGNANSSTGESGTYGGGSDTGGMFAAGGVVPRQHHAYGSSVTSSATDINPNDLSAIIAEQQQMYGPYSQEGMTTYGMKKGAQPGGKSSYVPQAMASAAHLMTPKDISPRGQTNTLSEITSDLGDIEKLNQYRKNLSGSGSDQTGGLLYKKPVGPGDAAHAGATLDSTTPDNLSDTFKNALSGFFGAKNGGVIDPRHGYATKGAVQMYGVDNLMSDVDSGVDQTPEQLIAEQKGITPGSSGSGSSGASGLSTALTLGKTILGFLPLAEGGVVPREHHADGDVVGNDQLQYPGDGPIHRTLDESDPQYGKPQEKAPESPSFIDKAISFLSPEDQSNKGGKSLDEMLWDPLGRSKIVEQPKTAGVVPAKQPTALPRNPQIGTAEDYMATAPQAGLAPVGQTAPQPAAKPQAGLAPQDKFDTTKPVAPTPNQNFAHSVNRTLTFEGPEVVRDSDGQIRRYGLTEGEAGVGVNDINPSTASPVYYNKYWLPVGADKMDPKMAQAAFDSAVNSGVDRAKQWVAQSDGDPNKLLDIRQQFLHDLAAKNPEKYGPYLKAWDNRISQLRADINGTQQAGLVPPADIPSRGAVNAQQTNAQPPQQGGGLTDTLTNEKFLVPLLAGLGKMAGSNSRYLGSAILQGIGGAAEAYENVQENMMQRQLSQPVAASRNIAVANQLQNGLLEYNATRAAAGLPPVTLQEYAKVSNYNGPLPQETSNAPYSGSPPSGSSPSSGPNYTYSVPEMNSLTINRNGMNIPAMSDQGYLRSFIAHNAGIQAPYIQSAVTSAQHNLDQIIQNQKTQNAAGETINAPGAIGAGQQATLADQRQKQSGSFVDQAIAFHNAAPSIKQNLNDLESIYSQFKSGAIAPAQQSFQQLMSAIDPNGNYPQLHNADASNYQSALKGAASLITSQLATMPAGAPKAELGVLASQIADPRMEPEAVHHILSRAKAAIDYQDQMYSGYIPEDENFDVQKYQNKFKNQNDYEKFVNRTESGMRPAAGSQGTITPETGKIYQDANGNKARWDGSKYIRVQ